MNQKLFKSPEPNRGQIDGDIIGVVHLFANFSAERQVLTVKLRRMTFLSDDFNRSGIFMR